jgi:hypothetical protein
LPALVSKKAAGNANIRIRVAVAIATTQAFHATGTHRGKLQPTNVAMDASSCFRMEDRDVMNVAMAIGAMIPLIAIEITVHIALGADFWRKPSRPSPRVRIAPDAG